MVHGDVEKKMESMSMCADEAERLGLRASVGGCSIFRGLLYEYEAGGAWGEEYARLNSGVAAPLWEDGYARRPGWVLEVPRASTSLVRQVSGTKT